MWNPMNVCSYHLQEAGATPVQEIAYSLATAIGVLDAVQESGQVDDDRFANGGRLDRVLRERRHPLRRGDLQDAGLHPDVGPHRRSSATASPTPRPAASATACRSTASGLTEAQPENNVQRIVLEMLGVTLSKRRPGPLAPAAGVERGPRPAPPLGPAVVAAHPAGAGLRDRPARVRRHLRRLQVDRGQDRRAGRRRPRPSSTTCSPSAARSRPSTSSRAGWCAATPSACAASSRATSASSASTRFTETAAVAARAARSNILQGRPGRRGRADRRRAGAGGPTATTTR